MSHLHITYERVEVDILKGESRTATFLQKNPNGRVPTLQLDTGQFLAESNSILWYLAQETQYWPADKFEQAQVLQWMGFEQYSHEPFIATSRFYISLLKQPEKFASEIKARQPAGYAALDVMERHLSDNLYFVADRYSIADIALFAYTHVAPEGGFDLGGYSNICRWLNRVKAAPAFVTIEE